MRILFKISRYDHLCEYILHVFLLLQKHSLLTKSSCQSNQLQRGHTHIRIKYFTTFLLSIVATPIMLIGYA